MNHEIIDFNECFNDSLEFVRNNRDHFFSAFYTNFLASSPRIQEKFKGIDLASQIRMLERSIPVLVGFFVTKKATEYLIEIALMHQKIGVGRKEYDLFLESLIKTLQSQYPHYNSNHGLSWRITLAPGIEFMHNYSDV